ncbi:MAG: 16S rRNA (cytosine(1402)-N(4))-methyltransferase RsmH [Arenicellales bacterium WSBS_2016_MAG_OTU3]
MSSASLNFSHQPVLVEPALEALAVSANNVRENGIYVDATFGRGGHTHAILARLGATGRVLAIDRDPDAIAAGQALFKNETRLTLVHARFSALSELLERHELNRRVTGLIIDLGISSPQVDNAMRGFSFLNDGPLDMRMDPQSGISAADWLASVEERELKYVIRRLGEERFAKRIASAIVAVRDIEPIKTTRHLAKIIADSVPVTERHKHPATRTFQAIRIFLNQELEEVENVLPQAINALSTGGRLVVISFHSLEDRMVKRFMRDAAKGDCFPPDFPVTADQLNPQLKLIGKTIRASKQELKCNPRARSAVMRIAEKIAGRVKV